MPQSYRSGLSFMRMTAFFDKPSTFMYHVYLRQTNGQIVGDVSHPDTADAARKAFAALVCRSSLDGLPLVAVLMEHKQPIAVHRFDQHDDSPYSWRKRLHQIPFATLH